MNGGLILTMNLCLDHMTVRSQSLLCLLPLLLAAQTPHPLFNFLKSCVLVKQVTKPTSDHYTS